jgi:hypothetical protein
MNRNIQLFKVVVARIIVFAVAMVGLAGFITAAFVVFPNFNDIVREFSGQEGALYWFLFLWYIVAWIFIGWFLAIRVWRIIGTWEPKEVKDEKGK